MVERSEISSEDMGIAFEVLCEISNRASQGEIANPGELLTSVRKFSDGQSFGISRPYGQRVYVRVRYPDGSDQGFGIHRNGLSDVSFCLNDGSRFNLCEDEIENEVDRSKFRNLLVELTPWFIGKSIGSKEPLSKDISNTLSILASKIVI